MNIDQLIIELKNLQVMHGNLQVEHELFGQKNPILGVDYQPASGPFTEQRCIIF
jgi:hypothetical protein